MRLFIAICLDARMKKALTALQRRWKEAGVHGNFTKEENMHLTLAFIGEFPDPEAVKEAILTVPFTPFELTLDGVGAFGDLFYAGLRCPPALDACVRRLRRALSEASIPFDGKRFTPHVTLLRRADAPLPPDAPERVTMTAERISLMRSDRGKNGMIYTEL